MSMVYFNKNFRYLRYQTKLSMSSLGKKVSLKLKDQEVSIPQIQSYESSTHPKFNVLVAFKDFYKDYDPSFSLEHLMERDLESENYMLPKDKVEENFSQEELSKIEYNEELIRCRKIMMDQAETINILIKQLYAIDTN